MYIYLSAYTKAIEAQIFHRSMPRIVKCFKLINVCVQNFVAFALTRQTFTEICTCENRAVGEYHTINIFAYENLIGSRYGTERL